MPNNTNRRTVLAGIAGGMTAGLAGCLGGESGSDEAKTVVLDSSPTDGDWEMYGSLVPYYTPVHETLTVSSHDFSEIEPWLATDWESTDDLVWEFTLRDDVTFHDGTEMTAEVVAESLEALLDDRPLNWAKVTDESFTATDTYTLEIETFEQFGALPGTMSHPLFGIQQPGSYDRPIGTGPYEVPEIEADEPVETEAYDEYWGEEPPLAELTFEGVVDPTTRSLNLQSSEVDASFEIPRQDYELLDSHGDVTVRTQEEPRAGLGMINIYNSPTDDEDLRRALNHAVDQEAIVENIMHGIGKPAKGPYSPMIPWSAHDDVPEYEPDMDRARELVDRSDYDGETLEIHVSSESPHEQLIATRMQDNFEEIGVSTTVIQFESGSFFETEQQRESNITLIELGSINGAADYLVFLQFHSEGGNNREVYEDDGTGVYNPGPEVDQLIEEGDRALDRETKHDAYREVQRRVMETAVVLPVYYKEYVFGQLDTTTGPDLHAVPHMTRWTEFEHDG